MSTRPRPRERRTVRRIAFGILRVFLVAALSAAGAADAANIVRAAAGNTSDDDDDDDDDRDDDVTGDKRVQQARVALAQAWSDVLDRPANAHTDAALEVLVAANEALALANAGSLTESQWQELLDDVTVAARAARRFHAARARPTSG